MSCQCEKCVECCWRNPGWFGSKEEIIGAAKIMNLPLYDFIKKFLIQEWYAGEYEYVSIPAPRRNFNRRTIQKKKEDENCKRITNYSIWRDDEIRNGEGFVRATWGHNLMRGYACILLSDDNLCLVHESKPQECRESYGCKTSQLSPSRMNIQKYWKKHQRWLEKFIDDS